MSDFVSGISFLGVADALFAVGLVVAGVLVVKKGVRFVLSMIDGSVRREVDSWGLK